MTWIWIWIHFFHCGSGSASNIFKFVEPVLILLLFRYKQVVERFTTMELINQAGFCQQFEKELRDGVEGNQPTGVFPRNEEGDARYEGLTRQCNHRLSIDFHNYSNVWLNVFNKSAPPQKKKIGNCFEKYLFNVPGS